MPYEPKVKLPGSERRLVPGATLTGPVSKDESVQVTIVLKRRAADPELPRSIAEGRHRTREEYGVLHGADPRVLDKIEKFAHRYGLTVVERNAGARYMKLMGPVDAMQRAFATELNRYQVPGRELTYRGRTGSIQIPTELEGSLIALLGLDNRPIAKPHMRRRAAARATAAGAFTPPQLAQLYNFPTGVTGAGQAVAIIELGGGYNTDDLNTYFGNLGVTPPQVSAVSVGGAQNQPGGDADGEVMLDIEVVGAVAPAAQIAVYFANNTDQGFHDAIAQAAHDADRKPTVISISWGGSEDSWTQQALDAMNAALQDAAAMGVTVTVASGDDGATDGAQDNDLHVDFPASSPYALACGGTTVTAAGGTISSEQVWNEMASGNGATGGGISRLNPLPSYQNSAGVPLQPKTNFQGRGVPDVCGDADPTTGYVVRIDGQDTVIGGTSAVAPLWAGLVALINQQLGQPVGFLNPSLYGFNGTGVNDITNGNNGNYNAGPGWDACTGLGSPNGAALMKALQGTAAAAVTA